MFFIDLLSSAKSVNLHNTVSCKTALFCHYTAFGTFPRPEFHEMSTWISDRIVARSRARYSLTSSQPFLELLRLDFRPSLSIYRSPVKYVLCSLQTWKGKRNFSLYDVTTTLIGETPWVRHFLLFRAVRINLLPTTLCGKALAVSIKTGRALMMDLITLYVVVGAPFVTLACILAPLVFEQTTEKEGSKEEHEDYEKSHQILTEPCFSKVVFGAAIWLVLYFGTTRLLFYSGSDWTKSGHEWTTLQCSQSLVTLVSINQLQRFLLTFLCFFAEDIHEIDEAKSETDTARKEKTRVLQVPTHKEQCSNFQKNVPTVEAKEEINLSKVHDLRPSEVSSTMTYLPTVVKIHHSAYMEDAQWDLVVKCKDSWDSAQIWKTLTEKFPKAIVRESETSVIVKILSKHVSSPTSFIVVGAYGPGSCKRMQVALFGGKAVLGKNWVIKGCLIDDDYSALKAICEAEERKGNRLLVQPRLLLVSNTGESIEFALQSLSKGWTLLHPSIQCMEPSQVWDFWSKAPDQLQQCSWTIQHEDKNKPYFDCQINVKQGEKSTYLPVLEYFKEEEEVVDVDENVDNNDSPLDATVSQRPIALKKISKDEKNARLKSAFELSVTRKRKSYPIV